MYAYVLSTRSYLGVGLEDAPQGDELAVELRLQVDRLLGEAAEAAHHGPVVVIQSNTRNQTRPVTPEPQSKPDKPIDATP